MARTLLVIGAQHECSSLPVELQKAWNVLTISLSEDLDTALKNTKVDLVLIRKNSLAETLEQASRVILDANHSAPILVSSDGSQNWLLSALLGDLSADSTTTATQDRDHPEGSAKDLDCPVADSVTTAPKSLSCRNIPPRITRALEFIEAHYDEPITLADAARVASYSRCYFCKIFKEKIGISFVSYLSRFRIMRAADLLLQSDNPITAIAFDVGFNDLSHFERVFRAVHKQSPSKFRCNAKNSPHEQKYPPSRAHRAVA